MCTDAQRMHLEYSPKCSHVRAMIAEPDQHKYSLTPYSGEDPGFLKGGGRGVQIRSTRKKGGPDGGPILGPMLKSLHRGTKGGGPDPLAPPWIRT